MTIVNREDEILIKLCVQFFRADLQLHDKIQTIISLIILLND